MSREEKIERYVECAIEAMDYKTMYLYVYESIAEDLEKESDENIETMYNEYFN